MDKAPWFLAFLAVLAIVAQQIRFDHALAEERDGWQRTLELELSVAAAFGRELAEAQLSVGHATFLSVALYSPETSYLGYPVCPLGDLFDHPSSPTLENAFIAAYNDTLVRRAGDAPGDQPEPDEDMQPEQSPAF
jgi:hypothetical protein